jgi:hypothetical protein
MSDAAPLFRFRRQTYYKNKGVLLLLADYITQVNTQNTNLNGTLSLHNGLPKLFDNTGKKNLTFFCPTRKNISS